MFDTFGFISGYHNDFVKKVRLEKAETFTAVCFKA